VEIFGPWKRRVLAEVTIYAAVGRIPTSSNYDWSSETELKVTAPSSGTWYFLFDFGDNEQGYEFTDVKGSECDPKKGLGENCDSIKLEELSLSGEFFEIKEDGGLAPQQLSYFWVNTGVNTSFSFSIAPLNPKKPGDKKPEIYAAIGNAPHVGASKVNFANGCNDPINGESTCEKQVVQIVSGSEIPKNEDVFFVVRNVNADNQQYAVWAGTVCGKNSKGATCNGGKCVDDRSSFDYGSCDCDDVSRKSGVVCSIKKSGFPVEYIVLIVIGSLVVLSAIIGFIAWAYMRRKRIHYQKV